MTLDEAVTWVDGVPETLAENLRPMAVSICESFQHTARRLLELGLGYLSLDRAGSTLSTGERQRVQLARAVRNRTTGVLYVLDEPSIGLHPANIDGLLGVMRDLLADGNSVVMVDHDTRILAAADYLVEMGPEAGAGGGHVVACGTPGELQANDRSLIGRYLPHGETKGAANAPAGLPRRRTRPPHRRGQALAWRKPPKLRRFPCPRPTPWRTYARAARRGSCSSTAPFIWKPARAYRARAFGRPARQPVDSGYPACPEAARPRWCWRS